MSDLEIYVEGRAGCFRLNRPAALNALTREMAGEMYRALRAWQNDDAIDLICVTAAGERAFCAGGDISAFYREVTAGNLDYGREFWAEEYVLNALIANYPKPYVAFMQGFTMGGGVGISAHGTHRIVTDGSKVAMPECSLGLVPDVGGTFLLARAPGFLGEFYGLSGDRMGPHEAVYAGFADYYIPEDRFHDLKHRVRSLADLDEIECFRQEADLASVTPSQRDLDDIFGQESLVDCLSGLESVTHDWGARALTSIRRNCPLAVCATFQAIRAARGFTCLEEALAQEYRFSYRSIDQGDFIEGIRASVIDKDRQPKWSAASIPAVLKARGAETMLASLGDEELEFPAIKG